VVEATNWSERDTDPSGGISPAILPMSSMMRLQRQGFLSSGESKPIEVMAEDLLMCPNLKISERLPVMDGDMSFEGF
jgi:hypothetical protein